MARTIAKDHDEKRTQILKSAAKVFAEAGYDRASMTQLARECGISKANIYHYYDSKEAVLFGLLDTYLCELRDRVCGVELEGLSADDRLRRVVAEVLLAYQGADYEHKVQSGSMGALPEEQQKLLRAYQREMVQFLSDTLQAVAPAVFAMDPAKLRATTMSVFGMLNWYYMWNSGAGSKAREDYADLVADLTLKGVRGL
ncbi:TetR/AcrR family transcriptional regulator [Pseudophaeobacter arcticus]|jgi:AcrR family transcriptional regulator|uniref:TetR/AcrR family transcriptional regulator n=1 Tax=Pseudophaeobacter arcticus TaxID=385492 RepID=UPI0004266A49|nr:TetR/AcrR family transcriptional regulator [Pseudophaeobacter arcticus]